MFYFSQQRKSGCHFLINILFSSWHPSFFPGGSKLKAEDALVAIGCQLAVDPVPSPFAGSKPLDVAKHVQWLRSRQLLQVEAALDGHKERMCVWSCGQEN